MPRQCSICTHADKPAINAALVAGEPYRVIAQRFAASPDAVYRHKVDHLPVTLTKAHEAKEADLADDLLAQVKALRNRAIKILTSAESAGDFRTALMGIREARSCIELLLEVEGELNRAPQVNVHIEWLEIKAVLMHALQPYPEARTAVAVALTGVEHGNG